MSTSTLTDNDQTAFQDVLRAVYEYYGKDLTAVATKLWWRALKDRLNIGAFEAYMLRHLETSQFLPRISDIVAGLNPHPAPEEAWNLAPKSEYEGGWVTNEIVQGLGACQDSLARGDTVGARMAFLERYKAAIAGKTSKPAWFLTRPIGQREPDMVAWEEQMLLTAPEGARTTGLHLAHARRENQQTGSQPLLTGGNFYEAVEKAKRLEGPK